MLINKWNWRDAGIFFEADQGSGSGESGTDSAGGTTSPEEIKAELERTRAALKAANKEAAERRKKLDDIEAQAAARKEQELTEAQKAAARAEKAEQALQALETRHRTTTINSAIRLAARNAGFVDPEDAVSLLDRSGLDIDESDTVNGVEAAIKALAKAKPHLLNTKQPAPNINANSGGAPAPVTVDAVVAQKRQSGMYAPL